MDKKIQYTTNIYRVKQHIRMMQKDIKSFCFPVTINKLITLFTLNNTANIVPNKK